MQEDFEQGFRSMAADLRTTGIRRNPGGAAFLLRAAAEMERLRELLERALESLHKIGNDLIPDRALAARDALEQIDAKVKKPDM